MRKNFLRFLVVGETETRGKMKKPPCLPSYDDVQVSIFVSFERVSRILRVSKLVSGKRLARTKHACHDTSKGRTSWWETSRTRGFHARGGDVGRRFDGGGDGKRGALGPSRGRAVNLNDPLSLESAGRLRQPFSSGWNLNKKRAGWLARVKRREIAEIGNNGFLFSSGPGGRMAPPRF